MQKQSFIVTSLVATLLFHSNCKSSKNRKAIIDSIVKYGVYVDVDLEPIYSKSPQVRNYKALTNTFSENELTELCEHQNPIVRCYAFKALTELGSPHIYDILLRHLSDTTSLDCGYDYSVTESFLDDVNFSKQGKVKYSLSESQYDYIDSILLFRDEIKETIWNGGLKYSSRTYSLERIKPWPWFYKRIKELVEDSVFPALPALARYKNSSDAQIFKRLLPIDRFGNKAILLKYWVRNSIQYFPHPSFYPILKKLALSEVETGINLDLTYELYTALAQYPTKETRSIFETVLKRSGGAYHRPLRIINKVIQKYPSKIFEGLGASHPSTSEE